MFVAEANGVEAVRSNQKVFELKPKFTPSAVAASGSVVAIGGEVSAYLPPALQMVLDWRRRD